MFLPYVILAIAAVTSAPMMLADRRARGEVYYSGLALGCSLLALAAAMAAEMLSSSYGWLTIAEATAMLAAGVVVVAALNEPLGNALRLSLTVVAGIAFAAVSGVVLLAPSASGAAVKIAAVVWLFLTVFALLLYLHGRRQRTRRRPLAVIVAGAFVVVHLAQLLRMTTGARWVEDAVFFSSLTLLLVFVALSAWVLGDTLRDRVPAYAKSGLSEQAAEQLFERIELLMERAAPFRDPDFDRAAIATSLGVPSRAVGEAVNRISGQSVPDYLRTWRVREADRLLRSPENRQVSLEALALEAGFRSRSAYYEAFRAEFGVTPGERRKQVA